MEYILQRYSNTKSTQGLLLDKDSLEFHSHTIEDKYQLIKVPGQTRIPSGFYELKILRLENDWTIKHRAKYGDWFKFPIEITNVPNYTGVLVHVGYGEQDTEGCILLADTIGNNTTDTGYIGGRSMEAVKRFYLKVYPYLEQDGKVHWEIRDENKFKL